MSDWIEFFFCELSPSEVSKSICEKCFSLHNVRELMFQALFKSFLHVLARFIPGMGLGGKGYFYPNFLDIDRVQQLSHRLTANEQWSCDSNPILFALNLLFVRQLLPSERHRD